jgi:hypothetical protein
MVSESVCRVARSWVDVGSFHTRLVVKFYDIHSVSLEYFGYTLVMFRRSVRRFLVLELRDEVGRVAQSV